MRRCWAAETFRISARITVNAPPYGGEFNDMKKTEQEMMTAVLAECNRRCPTYEWVSLNPLRLVRIRDQDMLGYNFGGVEAAWAIMYRVDIVCFIYDGTDAALISFAYRILGLEARDAVEELQKELEEAKLYRFKTMEEPAFQMMGKFVKFLNDALEADCPMVTNWGVKINETGEEIIGLNIWAATTHDSPITRCRELRKELNDERGKRQALMETAQKVINESQADYAVTTQAELGVLSIGFDAALASLDELVTEIKKGESNG